MAQRGFLRLNGLTVTAGDQLGIGRLGRYLLRAPVAVERMQLEAAGVEKRLRALRQQG